MNSKRKSNGRRRRSIREPLATSPPLLFGGFWLLVWLGALSVGGPWAGRHAVLFGGAAVGMLLFPPRVGLPRTWWVLAGCFVAFGALAFLPVSWFSMPPWRAALEAAGVNTGKYVAVQARHALESLGMFAITLLVGLWLAGHRPSAGQLRLWSLVFVVGVAGYALMAQSMAEDVSRHFGFFPNRNHTGTYLAMGIVCGVGCVIQALRDRKFVTLGIALLATSLCAWAVAGWTISRAGVVLSTIGCLLWLWLVGRRYLGLDGIWATALVLATAVGMFLIADSRVKQRLVDTVERTGLMPTLTGPGELDENRRPQAGINLNFDFRIPVAMDTAVMTRKSLLTGIGAGQYAYVIPQYRERTAFLNDFDVLHPESDWLWLAAETGVPATLALALLVFFAVFHTWRDIRHGHDRALRAACLAAALVVPIHGFFDVPGHRVPLAWSAAWLFALSLRPPIEDKARRPNPWLLRIAALPVLAAATALVAVQWFGAPQPAITLADHTKTRVLALYQEDRALQRIAAEEGRKHDPDPEDDLLEEALAILEPAIAMLPLDRDLRRLQSSLALHFEARYEMAANVGDIERILDPVWVGAPLRQADQWAGLDVERTAMLWRETLDRIARIEGEEAGNQNAALARERALHRIRQQLRRNPKLEEWLPPELHDLARPR